MNHFTDQIKNAVHEISGIKDRIRIIKAEFVKAEHPHQIGDVVKITGFSHTGKSLKVERRNVKQTHLTNFVFISQGTILKRDGTPGKLKTSFLTKWVES